jgi:hypothetical protein
LLHLWGLRLLSHALFQSALAEFTQVAFGLHAFRQLKFGQVIFFTPQVNFTTLSNG